MLCTATVASAAVTFTVDPDPAVPQDYLQGRITVTFAGTEYVWTEGWGTVYYAKVTDPTGATTEYAIHEKGDLSLYIEIEEALTQAGEYKVEFPGNDILNDFDKPVGEVTFTYTLTGNGKPDTPSTDQADVEITPAEGTVEQLEEFEVKYNNASSVYVNNQAAPKDYPYLASVNADGTMTKLKQCYGNPQPDGQSISFYLAQPYSTPGDYAIVIPVNYIKIDGEFPTEQQVFHYTIAAAQASYTYTIDPAPGNVTSMDKFTITFNNVENIVRDPYAYPAPSLKMIDESDGSTLENVTVIAATISDNAFTLTPYYPVTEEGLYKLTIPANYVELTLADGSKVKNDLIEERYAYASATALRALTADSNGRADVYTLNGQLVERNASVANIQALPAGVYVVKGCKVIVK